VLMKRGGGEGGLLMNKNKNIIAKQYKKIFNYGVCVYIGSFGCARIFNS
jgi:hypothetical protein